MKKLLLLLLLISTSAVVSAQVLDSENFNALTVGNVGTDMTGVTVGQGNLLTFTSNGTAPTTGTNAANSNFQIVANGNATTKGVKITGSNGNKGSRFLFKAGLPAAWAARTTGNNILEVEYDFYTGPTTTSTVQSGLRLYGTDPVTSTSRVLNGFVYASDTRILTGVCYLNNAGTFGTYLITLQTGGLILTADTWYRVGFAYNTTTGETIWKVSGTTPAVYTGLPAANWATPVPVTEIDFLSSVPTTNTVAADMIFDNYTAKAKATESLLGVSQVAEIAKVDFSVYPNPVNNIVTIENFNSALILGVKIADMNGRIVKELNSLNVSQTQINLANLNAGIYMMTITSDLGVTTKKIIKQ